MVAREHADVFHILDHGYAQLTVASELARTVVTCHDVIPMLAGRGVIPMRVPRHVVGTVWLRLLLMSARCARDRRLGVHET